MSKIPKIGIAGLGGQSIFLRVDHFHAPGETIHAQSLFSEPGGKGYNQAVAAQRLGGACVFLGAMADDTVGAYCVDFLHSEGIKTCIELAENCSTACACILTDSHGENQVTVFRGAADQLSPAFIRAHEEELACCDVLLLNLECPVAVVEEALSIAEKRGIYTILNPAPMKDVPMALLRRFSLLTPNFQEACAIVNEACSVSPAKLAEGFVARGLQQVVITMGSAGAMWINGNDVLEFPAQKVKAVDTTGAGDCFNGALAVALGRGEAMASAIKLAITAAGYSVCYPSVMNSLPTILDLERCQLL